MKTLTVLGQLEGPHHHGDAGHDLTCAETLTLAPTEYADINCGLRIALPVGTWGMIANRSSTPRKGLMVNTSIIDNGYRGPIKVCVRNVSDKAVTIRAGEQVAQLIVVPLVPVRLSFVEIPEDLGETARGSSGWGSTG